ncbi:DMT family transporter [Patescibacteria group bacterium]|nr:DMT family transporter [Patescibacteria group bacterium]
MKIKPSNIALLAIIGSSFFFSLPPVIFKVLYKSFEPMPLSFIRFTLAFLFMLPFLLKEKNGGVKHVLRLSLPISLLSSTNVLLFAYGIARTSADFASIIYTIVPLLVAILSYFILKERFTLHKILGILIGFTGIIFIIILPIIQKGANSSGDFLGNLLIFIASISWAGYAIGSRYLSSKNVSALSLASTSFFSAAVLSFMLTIFTAKKDFVSPLFNLNTALLILLLSCVTTVASFMLYQWAIKHSSATTASLNQYLQPVFTFTFAAIVLGEKLTGEFLIGAILVFAGVFIATNATRKISGEGKILAKEAITEIEKI